MPQRRRKTPGLGPRRTIRQRMADLPDVPVVAPDSSVSGDSMPAADRPQSATQPDPMEDRIRLMIEAAYT